MEEGLVKLVIPCGQRMVPNESDTFAKHLQTKASLIDYSGIFILLFDLY